MRVFFAVLFSTLLTIHPVFAEVADGGMHGGYAAALAWVPHWHGGLWYNRYEVDTRGTHITQPGLLSLVGGLDSEFDFVPVYLGFNADFYTPQILWKGLGLGVFYFACFIFTGGNCQEHPQFATGERDSGMADAGASLGVNFADFTGVPVRIYAGGDFGLFYSGLTPRPFSTLFVKSGVSYDFGDGMGLDFSVKRSVWMRAWDFGQNNGGTDPSLWIVGLNFIWSR